MAGVGATPLTVHGGMLLDHAQQAGPTSASPSLSGPSAPAGCLHCRPALDDRNALAGWSAWTAAQPCQASVGGNAQAGPEVGRLETVEARRSSRSASLYLRPRS